MAFIIETGAGVPNANAYASPTFVDAYLSDRNRIADAWQAQSSTRKQQAIVVATSYIDSRWGPRFKGTRLRAIIDGRAATGTLTLTILPALNQTATIGLVVYRFVDVLAQMNDVLRGASINEAAANLAATVTSGGDGVTGHVLTVQNYEVTASAALGVVTITAQAEGSSTNDIALATTVTGATATGAGKLTGGIDEGPQALCFPRLGAFSYDGQTIVGIPFGLKAATAEYAERSLAGPLDPDITVDASGALVQRKREKVGPIEEETEYAMGAVPRIYRDYPRADQLLAEYLRSAGGVIR